MVIVRLGIGMIISLFSFVGLYCTTINFKNNTINITKNRLLKKLIIFMLHCFDTFQDNIMRRYWMLTFDYKHYL